MHCAQNGHNVTLLTKHIYFFKTHLYVYLYIIKLERQQNNFPSSPNKFWAVSNIFNILICHTTDSIFNKKYNNVLHGLKYIKIEVYQFTKAIIFAFLTNFDPFQIYSVFKYITLLMQFHKEYMHYVVGSPSMTHMKHMLIHYECHFHTMYHIPYSIYHIPK